MVYSFTDLVTDSLVSWRSIRSAVLSTSRLFDRCRLDSLPTIMLIMLLERGRLSLGDIGVRGDCRPAGGGVLPRLRDRLWWSLLLRESKASFDWIVIILKELCHRIRDRLWVFLADFCSTWLACRNAAAARPSANLSRSSSSILVRCSFSS